MFLLDIDGKETEDNFLCDPNQGSPFDSVPCSCDSQLIDVSGKMYTLVWTCFETPKVVTGICLKITEFILNTICKKTGWKLYIYFIFS